MNQRLKRPLFTWIASVILLFVLSQTAGLLHAEIHVFHEHTESCDLFDHLGHPVDPVASFSGSLFTLVYFKPRNSELKSVFQSLNPPFFYGRAPPFA